MALALPVSSTISATITREGSLQSALREFRSILTEQERNDLDKVKGVPGTDDVLIFTAQLDAKRRTMKGRSIASRLHSVLQCVRDFSTVVDTFVSSHPDVAALVWGSVKLTMLVSINFFSYFEAMSELFISLGRACPQFSEYQLLFPDSKRVQRALCDFHAAIIRCCCHIVGVLRRPWHDQLLHSFWQSFPQEFKPDVDEIERHKDQVDRELELARTQATLRSQQLQEKEHKEAGNFRGAMRRIIGQTNDELSEMAGSRRARELRRNILMKPILNRKRTGKRREERKLLLNALSTHDYIEPHKQYSKKRYNHTAEWLFELPEFQEWASGDVSVLWCSGKIGSGKSIVTSSVINHLLIKRKDSKNPMVFFYPRFDDMDSLKSETILRSLARQAIESAAVVDDTLPFLNTLASSYGFSIPNFTQLMTMAAQKIDTLHIIIDGLDECEKSERNQLLGALSSLTNLDSRFQLFLASRDTLSTEIQKAFHSLNHISMSCSSARSDISNFVTSEIERLSNSEDLLVGDEGLKSDIEEALIKHADGMFLWVTFQLKEICSLSSDEEIQAAISTRNLPKDLTEVFRRAINRIVSSGKEDIVLKLLPWITAAARPMSLDELEESVMIEILQPRNIQARRVNGMSGIGLWFQGLVEIDEESKTVSFAHGSVRQYFLEAPKSDLSRFRVDLEEADHYLGEICCTYLFFDDLQPTLARRTRPRPPISPMDLARRAVINHWRPGLQPKTQTRQSKATAASVQPDLNSTLSSLTKEDMKDSFSELCVRHPFLRYASMHCFTHTRSFNERTSLTYVNMQQILDTEHPLARPPWKIDSGEAVSLGAGEKWIFDTVHIPLLRRFTDSSSSVVGQSNVWYSVVIESGTGSNTELIDTGVSSVMANALNYAVTSRNEKLLRALLDGPMSLEERRQSNRYVARFSIFEGPTDSRQWVLPRLIPDWSRWARWFTLDEIEEAIGEDGILDLFFGQLESHEIIKPIEKALLAASLGKRDEALGMLRKFLGDSFLRPPLGGAISIRRQY
ncbi:hypothetical protein NM208_g6478 [Fusarium decemcellulare]|uniref:Uncharacterized protein n=1 Tax=Fusarium decemcellulare TaxID=57161 RepID=A0ACC1SCT2_9HYPO|nr:hypothetical protein NM208_g6478 [Fusarium decemcellulare]